MTRSSFGMPDTSRAARVVLKDYVNAKLLYAHPPPSITSDEFMRISREQTLQKLEESFEQGRKRAPVTHVSKNADTFVPPTTSGPSIDSVAAPEAAQEGGKERQLTSRSVRANAASAPMRSGKEKASALDDVYFNDTGPAPRPVMMGRHGGRGGDEQEGGVGFTRNTMYPHQRMLGPDGMPLIMDGRGATQGPGKASKKHYKTKEGKKRSGRGYD